jgi:hypothetical protein
MKHEDIVELLPWYAAGSLEPEEAQAIETHLASCSSSERAELLEELDELKLVHSAVSVDGAEEPAFRPGLIQSALLQIEAMEAAEQQGDTKSAPGLLAQLSRGLNELMARLQWATTPRFARIAVIGQLAVVVGLAAALALQKPDKQPYDVLSGQQATPAFDGPQYSVTFNPELDHAAITAFLVERDLRVVGGPSALGVYTVAPRDAADEAGLLEQLNASPVTTFVAPVPR